MHRYELVHADDGDYITLQERCWSGPHDMPEPVWIEHTRWLIPGTQIED